MVRQERVFNMVARKQTEALICNYSQSEKIMASYLLVERDLETKGTGTHDEVLDDLRRGLGRRLLGGVGQLPNGHTN